AIRSRCLEVFFRELEKDELKTVAKTAADKIEKNISDESLDLLTSYTRNGREAVNMIQIAAGMAVTENRKDITIEDIEWVIHSSQLT
ncbi:ATP-dependent protease LonB, partial [Xanthomonas citri pv. citri]|nr:ATP-dependent protease LonB [Xanthomonas citri pv. citri]